MKRFLSVVTAVFAAFGIACAQTEDGHVLTGLWEQYSQSCKEDRPKTQADILSRIKQEAFEKRYSVDFYDASTLYVKTVSRINWKDREPARKDLAREIDSYGEPIVTFVWMDRFCYEDTGKLKEFAKNHSFEGCTKPFYRGVETFLAGVLPNFIQSDSLYVLWRLVARGDKESAQKLRGIIGEQYPLRPALDIWEAGNMAELSSKYAGTAAGLIPEWSVMSRDFLNIEESKPADDAPYRDFYNKCKDFEKRRAAFRGEESVIAKEISGAQRQIKELEGSNLWVDFKDRKVVVSFRNMASAKLRLYQSDARTPLKTWDVKNPVNSFYKIDTLSLDLPELNDGDYRAEVSGGDIRNYGSYQQYSLSVASRRDSRGICVYVAEAISGKPLDKATVYLKKGDRVVASAVMSLDGFTPLPSSMTRQIGERGSYSLYVQDSGRKSRTAYVDNAEPRYGDAGETLQCNIYRDRGAYNPGNEYQFKAVLFIGNPMTEYHVVKGRKLMAVLKDSEGNEIDRLNLKTNAFGSVSGKILLPKGLRNGSFSLQIMDGKESVGYDSFRVDEFVLPTFEIEIDRPGKLFLPGDDVPLDGLVNSYSGHSLSGARVFLDVQRGGKSVHRSSLEISPDGRFSFTVPKVEQGYYKATVKVVDAGGETAERQTWFCAGKELSVDMEVLNPAPGEFALKAGSGDDALLWRPQARKSIVSDDDIVLKFQASDGNGTPLPSVINYELCGVTKGTAAPGDSVIIRGVPSGLYTLISSVEERGAKGSARMQILLLRPQDKVLPADVEALFMPGEETVDGAIRARFGGGSGPAYAQITLFGDRSEVLMSKTAVADGVEDVLLDYMASYPDAARLQIFWFKDGKAWHYDRQYRRGKTRFSLPLTFTRFTDLAFPGTEYTFSLKTSAGVEAVAGVWDKSIDAVAVNWWPEVTVSDYSVPYVGVNTSCSRLAYAKPVFARTKSLSVFNMALDMDAAAAAMPETAQAAESVPIRSDFSSSLTFQPHLVSSSDGTLNFNFRTSDKLSTYYVRVYAHNPSMQNAVREKEMVVTIPVKVSMLEPRYLYVGDTFEAAVTVSSIAQEPVSGVVSLSVPGRRIQSSGPVTVPAGGTVTLRFPVAVPETEDSLTFTASFQADDFSDAVRFTVPVNPSSQTLTESYSAVLTGDVSREKLLENLRSRFVNVDPALATLEEISVLDMVRDAIPEHVQPSGSDALSMTEAWYTQSVSDLLSVGDIRVSPSDMLKQILSCRNSDGGYAWFEGMDSSPVITAVLLERFAMLKERGVDVPDASPSIKYLDKVMFSSTVPLWRGGLSDAQYMYIRALYPAVPFDVQPATRQESQRMASFKKYAKSYLTPSKAEGRGLDGAILAKARRLLTLRSLISSADGISLAKAWGTGPVSGSRLSSSLKADEQSLLEYAVPHRDGGLYFPNAVLPYRGLLESEAYAHSLLCRLFCASAGNETVADGIRLWLMLQKQTQNWDASPAFVDAIDAILGASPAVLDMRVLSLSAKFEAPFHSVKASGNGFTLERRFYRDGVEIAPGIVLSVGDRITVRYVVWNAENRSFVKLDAPREASLRPVKQLSGLMGRAAYRNVKAHRTEYFWEVFPEENTVITEEFYVTHSGVFSAPVPVIESLYASHYRANPAFAGALSAEAPAQREM